MKLHAILCLILHPAEWELSKCLLHILCLQFCRHNSTALSTDWVGARGEEGGGGRNYKKSLWLFLSMR